MKKILLIIVSLVCSCVLLTVSAEESSSFRSDGFTESEISHVEALQVVENVDENGQVFDPRISFPELAGKKQFLTFRTTDGKNYHIVVSYESNTATVRLLQDVSSLTLDQLAGVQRLPQIPNQESIHSEEQISSVENVEHSTEASEINPSNQTQWWIVIGGSTLVFIVAVYFKFFKNKKNKSSGFDAF
ncbi:hypothetical protein NHG34_08240 [Aerococcaceae bacterium NML190938]|nr:hypothetical protein [Aerococcaceae bacterium NML190938]